LTNIHDRDSVLDVSEELGWLRTLHAMMRLRPAKGVDDGGRGTGMLAGMAWPAGPLMPSAGSSECASLAF